MGQKSSADLDDRCSFERIFASIVTKLYITGRLLVGKCVNSAFIKKLAQTLQNTLLAGGLSLDNLPSDEALIYSTVGLIVTIAAYLLGLRRRKHLLKRLKDAEERLHYLQDKLSKPVEVIEKNEVRIFMDGAFDLLHYGHMNAFRLARSLGTHLIVGVNSDDTITACKGAPLMNDQERLTMVTACKFVDEVVPDCPYVMSQAYLDMVIEKYSIDFVIHGDDPCIVDGKDVYESAKRAGKFRTIPRTEGVSTTDIVGRMLLMTKGHHSTPTRKAKRVSDAASDEIEVLGNQSHFYTTSRMLQLFSAGVKSPAAGMHVVYIDGAWDLFHPGHVAILKAARERGDFLLVGIHGDTAVNRVRGMNLPLMNLHERVLSVLGCRYADDVLIDAPYEITREMIATLNISEVVRGTISDYSGSTRESESRYRAAKEMGILTIIDSPCDFRIGSIIKRIQRNQQAFQEKFESKMERERQFYLDKHQSNGYT